MPLYSVTNILLRLPCVPLFDRAPLLGFSPDFPGVLLFERAPLLGFLPKCAGALLFERALLISPPEYISLPNVE